MQKRTQYGRTILLLTVVSLAGCQLPSIAPKTNPEPETLAPNGATTSDMKPAATGGRYIQTATGSVWVPTQFNTQSSEDVVIPALGTWTQELPTASTLEMLARIDFPYPAGGTYVMNVWVNGHPVTGGLTNKPGNWFVNAWALNYAPNFEINNTPAAGIYYHPNGQACRYVWDVSSFVNSSPTMQVRVQNKGEYLRRPIVVRIPKQSVEVGAHFSPGIVEPLKDKEKSLDKSNKSKILITAKQNGVGVKTKVRIKASTSIYSGGHSHDHSNRPTGVIIISPNKNAVEWEIETDENGKAEVNFRSSGIGGDDIVTVSAENAKEVQANLRVSYGLVPLGFDGPDRARSGLDVPNMHLVGYTASHPSHHWCTEKTREFLTSIAADYAEANPGRRLEINDISLPDGGPFDLGPSYGDSWWTLTRRHLNHREGNSTDMPPGNRALRKIIRDNGGSIYDEGNHWHVTTL